MKLKPRRVNNKDRIKYLDTLYTAISSLKSRDEVKSFLRDLLTESERIMLGRRILIAKKLLEGQTYAEIVDNLHVGIDTIIKVHKWLEDESSGYEDTIMKIEKEFSKRKKEIKSEAYDPFTFAGMKRRYPLHFFLFNLFDKLSNNDD